MSVRWKDFSVDIVKKGRDRKEMWKNGIRIGNKSEILEDQWGRDTRFIDDGVDGCRDIVGNLGRMKT